MNNNSVVENEALRFVTCHVTLQQTILSQITAISEQYIVNNTSEKGNSYINKNNCEFQCNDDEDERKHTESPFLQLSSSLSSHPQINHLDINNRDESCKRYGRFDASLTPLFTLPSPSPGHPPLPHCNSSEDYTSTPTIIGCNNNIIHNARNINLRERPRSVNDVYSCRGKNKDALVYPTPSKVHMPTYSVNHSLLNHNERSNALQTNNIMENNANINIDYEKSEELTVNLSLILDAFEVLNYSPMLGEVLIREPSPLFESIMNLGISRWLEQCTISFWHNESNSIVMDSNEELLDNEHVSEKSVNRANINNIIRSWSVHLQRCIATGKFTVLSRLLILRIPHFLSMWSSVQDINNINSTNIDWDSFTKSGDANKETEIATSGNVRYNVQLIRHDRYSRWQSHTEVYYEPNSFKNENNDSNVCSLNELFHDISDIPLPEVAQKDWQEQTSNGNEDDKEQYHNESEKEKVTATTGADPSFVEIQQNRKFTVHDAVMCTYPETNFFHTNAHVCLRGVICELYFASREAVLPLPVALMQIWPSFSHTHGNTTIFIDVHLLPPHVFASSVYIGSTIEIRGQCIVPDCNVHSLTLAEVAEYGPPEVQAVITKEYIEVHSLLCVGICESDLLQTFLNNNGNSVTSSPLQREQTHNEQNRENCTNEYSYKAENLNHNNRKSENDMETSQRELFALRFSPPKRYSCEEQQYLQSEELVEEEEEEHSYTHLQHHHHNCNDSHSDSNALHHASTLPNGMVSEVAEEFAAQWSVRSWECSRLAMGVAPSFGTTTPLSFVCTNVFVCSLDAIIATLVSLFGGVMHSSSSNTLTSSSTVNIDKSNTASEETANKGEVGVSFLLIDEYNDSILSNILDRVRDVCLECFVETTALEVTQLKSYALLPRYEILTKPQQYKLLTEVLNHVDYRAKAKEGEKEEKEWFALHTSFKRKENATSSNQLVTEVIKGGLLNTSSHRTLILPRVELLNAESLQKLWHALEVATYTSHHTIHKSKGSSISSSSSSTGTRYLSEANVTTPKEGKNYNINNSCNCNNSKINTLDECVVCRQGGFKEHYGLMHSCICTVFNTPQLLHKPCLLEFAQRVDVVIRPYLDERRNILAFYGLRVIKWRALLRERGSWWMSLIGAALHTPSLHDVFVTRSPSPNKKEESSNTKRDVNSSDGEYKTEFTSTMYHNREMNLSARTLNVHFATPRLTEKCAELLQCYFVATKAISRELIDINLMSTLIRLTIAHASYRVKLMYTSFFDQAISTHQLKHENLNTQVMSNNNTDFSSNGNVNFNKDKRDHKYTMSCDDTYNRENTNANNEYLDSVLDELIPFTHCTPPPTTLIDALVAIGLCDSTLHFLTGKTFLGQCIFALLEREMQNACASELCKAQDTCNGGAASVYINNKDGSSTCAGHVSVEDEAANELEELYKYLEKVTRPKEMCYTSLPSIAPRLNFTLLHSFTITDIVNELRSHLYDGINNGTSNS